MTVTQGNRARRGVDLECLATGVKCDLDKSKPAASLPI
jgi:hypothetical protein